MAGKKTYSTDLHLKLSDQELTDLLLIRVWFLQERHLDLSLQEVTRKAIKYMVSNLRWINGKPEQMN